MSKYLRLVAAAVLGMLIIWPGVPIARLYVPYVAVWFVNDVWRPWHVSKVSKIDASMLLPRLYGDGEHDDTAAIEALVCMRKFTAEPGAIIVTDVPGHRPDFSFPDGRRYRLPRGFPMPRRSTMHIIPPDVGPTYEIDCEATI